MRFLVDAQLPPALAHWIIGQGHEATPVRDLNLRDSSDLAIWQHAEADECIIITKDEDFAARTWRTTTGPPVIWLRIGNCANTFLIAWLNPIWPEIIHKLEVKNRLIEVK